MTKKEYMNLVKELKKFDEQFINVKIAIKNLDKMGIDVTELYRQIDNVGIEMYKNKQLAEDSIKEHLDINIRL